MPERNWTDAELETLLAAEKARAKAERPWYKKKRYIIPIGFFGIAAIGSAAGDSDEDVATTAVTTAVDTTDAPNETAAPAKATTTTRVDAQKEDQESTIGGEGVRISGYTATVDKAVFQQSVSDFEKEGYLVADVTVVNRDDKTQPFSVTDWKLQTPQGQVLDITFTSVDQLDPFGNLVPGGKVSGKVVWKVGVERGRFIIIYKPDPFDAARGIWPVNVA